MELGAELLKIDHKLLASDHKIKISGQGRRMPASGRKVVCEFCSEEMRLDAYVRHLKQHKDAMLAQMNKTDIEYVKSCKRPIIACRKKNKSDFKICICMHCGKGSVDLSQRNNCNEIFSSHNSCNEHFDLYKSKYDNVELNLPKTNEIIAKFDRNMTIRQIVQMYSINNEITLDSIKEDIDIVNLLCKKIDMYKTENNELGEQNRILKSTGTFNSNNDFKELVTVITDLMPYDDEEDKNTPIHEYVSRVIKYERKTANGLRNKNKELQSEIERLKTELENCKKSKAEPETEEFVDKSEEFIWDLRNDMQNKCKANYDVYNEQILMYDKYEFKALHQMYDEYINAYESW